MKSFYLNLNINLNSGIKTSIHVFDSPIKQILLYNADVWGVRNLFPKRFLKCQKLEIGNCLRNLRIPCERIHLKFCKHKFKSVCHQILVDLLCKKDLVYNSTKLY